jgi:large conductance mechanosensitive channel
MREFLKGFKEFIMRGNVLDLAVAVVIGVAFNAVVQSFVNDILMQIVAALFGKADFSALYWTVHNSQIRIGSFITAFVNFLIIAFAVYLVVFSFAKLQSLRNKESVDDTPAPTDEAVLLREIRDLLAQGR